MPGPCFFAKVHMVRPPVSWTIKRSPWAPQTQLLSDTVVRRPKVASRHQQHFQQQQPSRTYCTIHHTISLLTHTSNMSARVNFIPWLKLCFIIHHFIFGTYIVNLSPLSTVTIWCVQLIFTLSALPTSTIIRHHDWFLFHHYRFVFHKQRSIRSFSVML